jgi:hypothetical protein
LPRFVSALSAASSPLLPFTFQVYPAFTVSTCAVVVLSKINTKKKNVLKILDYLQLRARLDCKKFQPDE